jgi:hypothetical protein
MECNKQPTYNYEGYIPKYCADHKKDGMINVISKKCQHNNCDKRPSFNIEGQKIPIYCIEHKLNNMINIINKKCAYENCKKTPSYNFRDQKLTKYCVIHKLVGMVDVKSIKCEHINCDIGACFNIFGEKPKFCATHKLINMIDLTHKKCIYNNCSKISNFNFQGQKRGIYCSYHKKIGMVDIKNKQCKICTTTKASTKYEGYCFRCFIYTFPEKPVSTNYKTKERSVVDYVLNTFPEYDWISDKKVMDGCSKRRPDLLLDLGYQVLIIEIDETQHRDYDCSCENKRMMEISKDVDHRPIIFIRFNPDTYINKDNEIVKSCWKVNNLGICCINKKKETEWNKRLESLKSTIEYWCNDKNKTDKTLEIIHLYYDEFIDEDTKEDTENTEITNNIVYL